MARKKQQIEWMSQRAYARHRGCSPGTVNAAVQSGRISTTKGKIDPRRADGEWSQNTDPSTPKNSVSGNPKQRRAKTSPPTPSVLDKQSRHDRGNGDGKTGGYAANRAAREYFEARLKELDLKQRSGALVSVDDVKVSAFNMARRARDQLITLPDRISTELAATEDPAEIHSILIEEIERICKELSNGNR